MDHDLFFDSCDFFSVLIIFSNFVVTEIYSQVDFLTFDLQILSTGKPRPHPTYAPPGWPVGRRRNSQCSVLLCLRLPILFLPLILLLPCLSILLFIFLLLPILLLRLSTLLPLLLLRLSVGRIELWRTWSGLLLQWLQCVWVEITGKPTKHMHASSWKKSSRQTSVG